MEQLKSSCTDSSSTKSSTNMCMICKYPNVGVTRSTRYNDGQDFISHIDMIRYCLPDIILEKNLEYCLCNSCCYLLQGTYLLRKKILAFHKTYENIQYGNENRNTKEQSYSNRSSEIYFQARNGTDIDSGYEIDIKIHKTGLEVPESGESSTIERGKQRDSASRDNLLGYLKLQKVKKSCTNCSIYLQNRRSRRLLGRTEDPERKTNETNLPSIYSSPSFALAAGSSRFNGGRKGNVSPAKNKNRKNLRSRFSSSSFILDLGARRSKKSKENTSPARKKTKKKLSSRSLSPRVVLDAGIEKKENTSPVKKENKRAVLELRSRRFNGGLKGRASPARKKNGSKSSLKRLSPRLRLNGGRKKENALPAKKKKEGKMSFRSLTSSSPRVVLDSRFRKLNGRIENAGPSPAKRKNERKVSPKMKSSRLPEKLIVCALCERKFSSKRNFFNHWTKNIECRKIFMKNRAGMALRN